MPKIKKKQHEIIAAAFLVSGTSIGGGMLAQPAAASVMGFIPSSFMIIAAWIFMTSTALILAEICVWLKSDVHIISIASRLLGFYGKTVAWAMYLFIAYLSLTAYIAGGGELICLISHKITATKAPEWIFCLVFVLVFGATVEISEKAVGKINSMLFIGLIFSYFAIVLIGSKEIHIKNVLSRNWNKSLFILPLLLTSFSFQMIVPSVANYLKRDLEKIKKSILIGTTISLIFYVSWNFVMLGNIAPESNLLEKIYTEGKLSIEALVNQKHPCFVVATYFFSFFAIATSFIGISWGLFDFLADGLNLRKSKKNRVFLWIATMLPPLVLASTYPRSFIGALETTGGYGDVILNGIVPVLIFWIAMKYKNHKSSLKIIKTPAYLIALALFSFVVLVIQALNQFCKNI